MLTLRGEAAYRRPYDWQNRPVRIARPDVQYALGADHTFGSLSIIVQYLGRYVFDWQKQSRARCGTRELAVLADPGMPDGLHRPGHRRRSTPSSRKINQILFSQTARVQHLATLRFEWLALHETLSISSLCLYNFTTQRVAGHAAHRLPAVRRDDRVRRRAGVPRPERHAVRPHRRRALSAGYAELRSASTVF